MRDVESRGEPGPGSVWSRPGRRSVGIQTDFQDDLGTGVRSQPGASAGSPPGANN